MNKNFTFLVALAISLTTLTARAQPRPPTGPNIDGAMEKLFGENGNFSATTEIQTANPRGGQMDMTTKMAHTAGKTRIEMDLAAIQGANIPPQAMAQMQKMGMGHMVVLNNTSGMSYMVYPDMQAYVPLPNASKSGPASDYKVDVTKLGDETIDGHSCVKNKCVVTGPSGPARESTVWNATDLKNFPVKIETKSGEGPSFVLLFKDVKLDKPDDSQFDLPSNFQKYDDMMSLMMSKARPSR